MSAVNTEDDPIQPSPTADMDTSSDEENVATSTASDNNEASTNDEEMGMASDKEEPIKDEEEFADSPGASSMKNQNKSSFMQSLKENRTKPFIVLVAVCAALGGLIFGYDIAGAGATFVMDGFRLHFGWDCAADDPDCVPATQGEIDRDQGLINGLFGAGATLGAIANPWVADKYGRRKCLFASSVVFIFGAAMQAGAINMQMMYSARIFSGFGIGGLSMCSPVYISEVAPEHVRGALATLWQLAITAGILIASAANIGLKEWDEGWRISYGGNILFALLLIFSLFFMPESPRWLAAKGEDERLRSAMSKIRYEEDVENEIVKVKEEVEEEKRLGIASWREVFSKENTMRYRLYLGTSLQAIQQLAGINAIMFYAPTIFEKFFGADQAVYMTFILNGINFLSTFITIYAVDRVGRVKLLLSGGIVMMLSLIANAVLASMEQTIQVGYAVLAFSAVFIIGFAYSWGPVVWVVCSELFPLRQRGKATGLTTMTNWIMTTIVGAVFPAASTASLAGCFGFFAGMIFIGMLVVYFYEAETSNRTILEIDDAYAKHQPKLKRKEY